MAETEPSRSIVTLDVAKSNRSTCKATGEKIEKGEHRVGVEAYSGGHISMTWQVEECRLGCPDTYCKVYRHLCGTIVSKSSFTLPTSGSLWCMGLRMPWRFLTVETILTLPLQMRHAPDTPSLASLTCRKLSHSWRAAAWSTAKATQEQTRKQDINFPRCVHTTPLQTLLLQHRANAT